MPTPSLLWVLSLFGALLSSPVRAQGGDGSIRGLVLDADFEAPLPAARVLNVDTGQQVETNDQGNYLMPEVPPGQYTLVFSKPGYVRVVRAEVVVVGGRLTDIDVSLSGEFVDMEEFVVQDVLQFAAGSEAALLNLRFEAPSMMDSISADLMSRAGASDAASALKLVAGASVQNGKSAVIRGLPDRYVSSQMNGVRLPTADEDKRAVELDQFPSAVIESIQVSKTFTPDQQGDASGGAVDVRLKGIPEEAILQFSSQVGYDTQATNNSRFRTYRGGGVSFWGRDDGGRDQQLDSLGENWDGAVETSPGQAPTNHKWSLGGGGRLELDREWTFGGFGGVFYEQDSSFYDNGIDDKYWVTTPGAGMTPKETQGTSQDGDFKTNLFDVVRSQDSVRWGGLATFGLESENHFLGLTGLYTRNAADTATRATDTRGKQYYFPGYDPNDEDSPGYDADDSAPYLVTETLEYTERTTQTLQLNGRHTLASGGGTWLGANFDAPELSWTLSSSGASLDQPDKRQFGGLWSPNELLFDVLEVGGWQPFKPGANFNFGNLQRIWKQIEEDSEQAKLDLEFPFDVGEDADPGSLRVGVFQDVVNRDFYQDSFGNFGDNSGYWAGFEDSWGAAWDSQDHPITESTFDIDYRGRQKIAASYAMFDVPLSTGMNLIGGARFESTDIDVNISAEEDAFWYQFGTPGQIDFSEPGIADADFEQDDVLPSLSLVYEPTEQLTLRAAYSETIARQTFKELTPVVQQEYLGGPIFLGNPDLRMSNLENFDLRFDYTPYEGGLASLSFFHKSVEDAIEYVAVGSQEFQFTTALNYPKGELTGWEFEVRHAFDGAVEGLGVGANATLIDSEVELTPFEIEQFALPGVAVDITSREMTNAPEHLFNLYTTYDLERTGTNLALFYTVQGDTLVEGAGIDNGNFVPSVFQNEYDTLNFSASQDLGDGLRLQFRAKNLTNPLIERVYRHESIGDDVTRTSFTRGIEYSLSISYRLSF